MNAGITPYTLVYSAHAAKTNPVYQTTIDGKPVTYTAAIARGDGKPWTESYFWIDAMAVGYCFGIPEQTVSRPRSD